LGEVVLHFSVADTGIGIAPDKRQQIFDPFTQADGSMTRRYGGTGLGLTICTRLVELMGGRIWVDSEVGKGSTFHFTARLAPAAAVPERPAGVPVEQLRGLAVLVADDNATNRRILEEMLRGWEMRPTMVDGGGTALAELRRAAGAGQPYPLVLIDGFMPEMDGFALAEHIRREPNLARAAVMMLTSVGHQADAHRCRELGLASYLIKPIKASELLEAIQQALAAPHPPAVEPAPPAVPVEKAPAAGLRVLVAEDNAVNQRVAARLLEKLGHAAVIAANGREALERLAGERFDLVLLDVQMPEMDGLEVATVVRQREQGTGRHLPVIALTAHAMRGDRERCLEAGMDGYLAKPIDLEELRQAIAELAPCIREWQEAGAACVK
jgi:CheY-like chemotaxis protein